MDEIALEDFIFLLGIFIFFTILIIGLFPGSESGLVLNRDFFIFTIMTIPIIAAIYFIVMSFRRTFYRESMFVDSSIRNKMALAFVFVAVLPALIILLVSNNFINKAFTNIYTDKTSRALRESIVLAEKNIDDFIDIFEDESVLLSRSLKNEKAGYILSWDAREQLRKKYDAKNISMLFFMIEKKGKSVVFRDLDSGGEQDSMKKEIIDFVATSDFSGTDRIDRVNIGGRDILIDSIIQSNMALTLHRDIPPDIIGKRDFFIRSFTDYKRYETIKLFFKENVGIFMLVLSIVIVVVSILISLALSKNITRPVMELVDAAKQLSYGNFKIRLYRKSNDELGLLYKAFNHMVMELDGNKRLMYQKQKLEAWREMATKLVHEIKNPLTPIRLSAERMRRRFLENHKDIDTIIVSGSETIIEEVDALMALLKEFTNFARLPVMKPEQTDINRLVENCVNFFSGHENIKFTVTMDPGISHANIDKILLRQAITNLIQNSIHAVKERGNISVITELVVVNYLKHVRIRILDDGIGIDESEIEKIFEPGYSKKAGGTGLGLPIVEMIVFEHNGKISCKSEKGKGAEFSIDLPIE